MYCLFSVITYEFEFEYNLRRIEALHSETVFKGLAKLAKLSAKTIDLGV